ncbi:Serine/threonine protein kinase PrkC, regulator of stationary phase [hydrothermal vent metagenome]|uniref:Serine/threonine protein kinase PrkC, regulator of stationary phase n=1 Tax=hydrothermal vent metagenome TaxID=652676 RepID=A0A3B0VDE4_9ZZZZ
MSGTLSGKKAGKYVIKEKLGTGGMAEVYKGYQENLDRYVAIKLMHAFLISDQDFLNRFQREARAMASLNHPNIVGVYDFDVYDEDSYYLVMEYVRGGTLKEHLEELARNGEHMPLTAVVKMVAEIADALAYAHRREMVHRDIKPANIMLNEDTERAVLTDFGIVKLLGNQAMAYTATGALIGTPAYMSPEQALGNSGDHRVDIYSLGVMLFQMVTGTLPFDAETPLAIVMQHVNTPTPLPDSIIPGIPWGLQEVILKAMAKIPEDRYASAGEFAAALRSVDLSGTMSKPALPASSLAPSVKDYPTPATTEVVVPTLETAVLTPSPPAEQPKKRPKWLIPVIGVVVSAAIAGILAVSGVFGSGSPTPTIVPVAIVEDTPEATETNTPRPTNTQAPDAVATSLAQLVLDLTAAARPTETPTPSKTPTATATATATVNATSEFLLNCETAVELVAVSRNGFISNAVTTQFNFTAAWELKNSGTCPWPANLQWEYVEGETFDYDDGPILLEEAVEPGDEISLTALLKGPQEPGTYESSWQLVDADGKVYGEPITFEFRAFLPATSTPIPTNTPEAPATAEAIGGQVNWIFTVGSCNYLGGSDDWRCQVTITPYIDGSDQVGDYTLFVFDLPGGQAAVYRGTGPFVHFVRARRCAAYNQEVRVVDDLTATELTRNLYVDPNVSMEGGCTEP